MSKEDSLKGHYEIVYSPDEKGFYCELWWNNQISPVYGNLQHAYNWAHEHGGKVDHTRRPIQL